MVLRAGNERDLAAMYALDVLCFDRRFRFTRMALHSFALAPGAIGIVAEEKAALTGFLLLNRTPLGDFSVATLDVHPASRRRGIARRLMEAGILAARTAGAKRITLEVFTENRPAILFYEASGFLRLERRTSYYGLDLDAWRYGLDLLETAQSSAAKRVGRSR